jgi:hypothetical protein
VAASVITGASPRVVVVAAAIPILFLHVRYQPGFGVHAGGTTVNAYLSDFAVLAVVLVALSAGIRDGFARLRPARILWLVALLFFVWVAVGVAVGASRTPGYATHTHLVTAAKFAEYALLAPALPLLLRTVRELELALWSLAVWSSLATIVGIAQFFGAAIFLAGTVGRRQASFLSSADFAALSGAALLAGAVALAFTRAGLSRRLGWFSVVAGALGMIVAGALAAVLGMLTAGAVLLVVLLVQRGSDVRRVVAVAAAFAVVVAGAVAIRGSDLDAFARFLGASPGHAAGKPSKVQTYAHRTLLSWLGWQIFLDHPALGVGWEGSAEPGAFEPYLPAARRHFPDESANSFPSATRRYGVQDAWIEAAADLGAIGFLLWAAVFAGGLWLAARADTAAALLGLAWICLVAWLWSAQGFVAGIPLDALTWFAFGLAATAAAWRSGRV